MQNELVSSFAPGIWLLIIVSTCYIANVTLAGKWTPDIIEEAGLDTLQVAHKYGYDSAQMFMVETRDHYFLPLFNIPYGPNNRPKKNENPRPVVLLQHCILCSSKIFVMMGPERGLAFILADNGYNVWLGDFRGSYLATKYGEDQINSKTYYDFSWEEMGLYDYPAFIDAALKRGNQKKLIIIGHSMGTTAAFVMASMKSAYTESKVSLIVALSPVAYMKKIESRVFRTLYGPVATAMNTVGITHVDGNMLRTIGKWLCLDKNFLQKIYARVYFKISGYNWDELDQEKMPILFGNIPAGASTKSLMHYGQLVESGRFARFDYGPMENMQRYRQETPPDYNLLKISVPMLLFYAENDWLSDIEDVEKLAKELLNANKQVDLIKVDNDNFNHMDFLFAKNVVTYVYSPLIAYMKIHVLNLTRQEKSPQKKKSKSPFLIDV